MKTMGSNSRGVALIVVLLMVSIITALTIQFSRDTRADITAAANLSDGIRLRSSPRPGSPSVRRSSLPTKAPSTP